jgi:hypothetical protein
MANPLLITRVQNKQILMATQQPSLRLGFCTSNHAKGFDNDAGIICQGKLLFCSL